MTVIGYHASHEQFTPADLLRWAQLAERAGFGGVMSSDHFHPWSDTQGQSGFAWSWLGAALQATALRCGVISVPGWRYHPAILAQAAATLMQMFPDRFWLALGSGEALNECITGKRWPPKSERQARLEECARIIRRLWAGELVTHYGRVTIEEARLYTRPARPPLLLGAAVSEATAEWVGGWADGLLTVSAKPRQQRKVVEAFRRGGGDGKPMYLQVTLSWAETAAEALREAHEQWRFCALAGELNWELASPQRFAEATRTIRPDDMHESVLISHEADRHAEWLAEYLEMGFSELYLHQVGTNQQAFIETFGERVLPRLASAA